MGFVHEADLLVLSSAGVFHECEIKISAADLRRDALKRNCHNHDLVSMLWFALGPAIQEKAMVHVPEGAGIITFASTRTGGWYHTVRRRPRKRPRSRKPTPAEIEKFLRLGVIRMWARNQHYGFAQTLPGPHSPLRTILHALMGEPPPLSIPEDCTDPAQLDESAYDELVDWYRECERFQEPVAAADFFDAVALMVGSVRAERKEK